MKGIKTASILAVCLGASVMMSGCSFSSLVEKVVGTVASSSSESVTSSTSADGIEFHGTEIDETLNAPKFDTDIGTGYSVLMGGSCELEVSASVDDGGKVTYQWYRNNTNSNGGGTVISGATDQTYTPDTSEKGTDFYYAVATNTKNGKCNMSVSLVSAVTVWEKGNWQKNEEVGGYRYMIQSDGSYPTETSMEIDGQEYSFNTDGYAVDENGNYVTPEGAADASSTSSSVTPAATAAPTAAATPTAAAAQAADQAASDTAAQ